MRCVSAGDAGMVLVEPVLRGSACGGGSKSCDVTSEILTESADAQVNGGWNWVKARKPCGSYL